MDDRKPRRPLLPPLPSGRTVARWLLPRAVDERIDDIEIADRHHGFDAFGMSRGGIAFGLAFTRFLYEAWFRVESHGLEHIPATGPVVVACNHSGFMPLDGLMVGTDLLRRGPRGRAVRVVMDHFVPNLPWVNILFQRAGALAGSRGNFHAVLEDGGLIVVFPEGTPGIGKGFQKRYQLQRFRDGHAELAVRHGAVIVPTAVVGSEEAWAQIARIDGIKFFGAPYLPIPMTPLPLPVRYHIWYGEPIDVAARTRPEDADDAEVVRALADEVRDSVADLIRRGLRDRHGWFG